MRIKWKRSRSCRGAHRDFIVEAKEDVVYNLQRNFDEGGSLGAFKKARL